MEERESDTCDISSLENDRLFNDISFRAMRENNQVFEYQKSPSGLVKINLEELNSSRFDFRRSNSEGCSRMKSNQKIIDKILGQKDKEKNRERKSHDKSNDDRGKNEDSGRIFQFNFNGDRGRRRTSQSNQYDRGKTFQFSFNEDSGKTFQFSFNDDRGRTFQFNQSNDRGIKFRFNFNGDRGRAFQFNFNDAKGNQEYFPTRNFEAKWKRQHQRDHSMLQKNIKKSQRSTKTLKEKGLQIKMLKKS